MIEGKKSERKGFSIFPIDKPGNPSHRQLQEEITVTVHREFSPKKIHYKLVIK